ncbi:MAG: preprotein translocase subunit SecG [Pseudomonadota bacterium]
MQQILLIVHLMIALALVGVVLLQRSEGGGLGIGGGGGGGGMGGGGGLMSVRGTANLLTRITAVLAASFMLSSMLLAILGARQSEGPSVFDTLPLGIEQTAPESTLPELNLNDTEPATNVPLD